MKKLGLKKFKFPAKVDYHIVGFKNWWEGICCKNSNKRDRALAKLEIIKYLNNEE